MSARKTSKPASGTKNPYGYPFWEWVAKEDPSTSRPGSP